MSNKNNKRKHENAEDREVIFEQLVDKFFDTEPATSGATNSTTTVGSLPSSKSEQQDKKTNYNKHSRPDDEIKDIKQVLLQRTRHLFVNVTASDVTRLAALHLSTDFNLAQAIARYWMKSSYNASRTLQQEFTQQIWELLTSEIDFSVRCVTTPRQMQGNWYLFGLEQRDFTIPFELLRYNSTVYACLIRLMFQGNPLAGQPVFGSSITSVDNSEVRLSRFDHNHTFNTCLSRAQLLCAFMIVHSATTRITGAIKSEINAYRTMRLLFLSSLQTCIDRLKPQLLKNKMPWLTEPEMVMIERLRDHCTIDQKFTPKELCALYSARTTALCHASEPI